MAWTARAAPTFRLPPEGRMDRARHHARHNAARSPYDTLLHWHATPPAALCAAAMRCARCRAITAYRACAAKENSGPVACTCHCCIYRPLHLLTACLPLLLYHASYILDDLYKPVYKWPLVNKQYI